MSFQGPPFEVLSTCRGGGYHYCRTDPPHPKANAKGLYPLHRVLIENRLGRLLEPNEVVHHRDENKWNDDDSNLAVMLRSEHSRLHAPEVEKVPLTCPVCRRGFSLKPAAVRLRAKRKRGEPCCSRRCGAIQGHELKSSASGGTVVARAGKA